MEYAFTGNLEAHVAFAGINSIEISVPFSGVFYFPSRATTGTIKDFRLTLQASNDAEARLRAEQILADLGDWLSVSLDIPVRTPEINEMTVEGRGVKIVTTSFQTSSAIVKLAETNDIVLLAQVASKAQSLSPERADSLSLAFSLYRQGRAAKDHIKKFWSFYRTMIVLDKIIYPNVSRGERRRIDALMKILLGPTSESFLSDHDGNEWTPFIALRDSFSHGATFSGNPLDISIELPKYIRSFEVAVRKALIDEAIR